MTQQVEGSNLNDLMEIFNTKSKWESNTLNNARKEAEKIGFKIKDARGWYGKYIFKDVGAIVYFLKAIPWIVDNFSVNDHLTYLKKLQEKIDKEKELVFSQRLFLILVEK